LYGLATVAAGILDLVWGEFEGAHQPIQALGDDIPGRVMLAYITAACMITAGIGILWRETARGSALASAFIYLVFGMFWLMVLIFELVLVPLVLAHRDHHIAWGSNAYNLAAAGALAIFSAANTMQGPRLRTFHERHA
jgi:hypothetical protein